MKQHHKDPMSEKGRAKENHKQKMFFFDRGHEGERLWMETTYMGKWQGAYWPDSLLDGINPSSSGRWVLVGEVASC